MKISEYAYLIFLPGLALVISSFFWVTSSTAADTVCAKVKIEIAQQMTFERQAFDAHMQISNGLTTVSLQDVNIEVLFTDENKNPVRATSNPDDPDALFFIKIESMEGIDNVSGTGAVAPSTTADIHWLIIPAPASVVDYPQGALYYVGARLSYSLNGEENSTTVTPDYINVKPLPLLSLDYFLPEEVYGDDPFTAEEEPSVPFSLGVRIANNGQGVAGDVKIDSAQVKITDNDQGLAVDFFITGTEVNGEVAPDSLLLRFGDLAAGSTAIGRWLMTCSLSGRFTEFDAQFIHSDDLGGELTSIIEEINQHFLVRDVLVDLPGRDTVRDFLGRDGVSYTVYESDAGISAVSDMSDNVAITHDGGSGLETVYTLKIPPTEGFIYFTFDDPEQGSKIIKEIVRSDGKVIKPDNAWLAKKRVDADWSYSANVFDFNTSGTYIMTMIDPSLAHQPPEFEDLSDPVVKEGGVLEFLVKLKCSEGDLIRLDVSQLPVGAEFIDLGNCTGILRWTPQAGQAGDYPITLTASDGELSRTQRFHLTVTDLTHVPVARFLAAPTSVDIAEEVRFTDESASEDGIQSWRWDFGDGTTSADRHPTHAYETAGTYTVSLTVTERDNDRDTVTFTDFITVASPDNYPVMEFGFIQADSSWKNLIFEKIYKDPVVISSATGVAENRPVSVRFRNIDSQGCEIRLEESRKADGGHDSEEVPYIVMEAGVYLLDDKTKIIAAHLESSEKGKFATYTYPEQFAVTPVVTASLASDIDPAPVRAVLRRIQETTFQLGLDNDKSPKKGHKSERVDYIAWEPSFGLFNTTFFEVGYLDQVNNRWQSYDFEKGFNKKPVLLSDLQEYSGKKKERLRIRNLSQSGLESRLLPSHKHASELVGYIGFSTLNADDDNDEDGLSDVDEHLIYGTDPYSADSDQDGIPDQDELRYWGDSWSADIDNDGIINILDADSDNDGFSDGIEKQHDFDPADPADFPVRPIMEFANTVANDTWRRITFKELFIDPVVVATLTGSVDAEDPASVRLRNINNTGFEIRLEEKKDDDFIHGNEGVSYIVMERGSYSLEDGSMVFAAHLESSEKGKFAKYKFPKSFKRKPVLTVSLASYFDQNPASTALRNINKKGFQLRLISAGGTRNVHKQERVEYIAWEPSLGRFGDTVFEVGYMNNVNSSYKEYTFADEFAATPVFLADPQNFSGNSPLRLLGSDMSNRSIWLRIDGIRKKDREKVGYIGVSNAAQ